MVEFRVLGALEIRHGSHAHAPTAPRERQVLALLIMRANQAVPLESLLEELWDDSPPKSAVTTAQTYIYRLRTMLANKALCPPGPELLQTRTHGYVLRIEPGQLDADVFQQLVATGRGELESGRLNDGARTLRRALAMWTGAPLANVRLGRILQAHVLPLEEHRLRALEMRIQAELGLGEHRELIGELRSLVAAHPLNEWFHAQLITALGRAGRRSDALLAYQHLRTVLNRELGLEPSHEVERLQLEVLTNDYSLAETALAGVGRGERVANGPRVE